LFRLENMGKVARCWCLFKVAILKTFVGDR
jgi:hypothetical protein